MNRNGNRNRSGNGNGNRRNQNQLSTLPSGVLATIARHLRARNMARVARTSRSLRAEFNPLIERRLTGSNALRNALRGPARSIGIMRRIRGTSQYHPAQSAVYQAISRLITNYGGPRTRPSLANLRNRVYSPNAARNYGFVTRVGPWWVNTGNHTSRNIPREITLINNRTGNTYHMRYNPNTRRYNAPYL
jgi:hypothetical protein